MGSDKMPIRTSISTLWDFSRTYLVAELELFAYLCTCRRGLHFFVSKSWKPNHPIFWNKEEKRSFLQVFKKRETIAVFFLLPSSIHDGGHHAGRALGAPALGGSLHPATAAVLRDYPSGGLRCRDRGHADLRAHARLFLCRWDWVRWNTWLALSWWKYGWVAKCSWYPQWQCSWWW